MNGLLLSVYAALLALGLATPVIAPPSPGWGELKAQSWAQTGGWEPADLPMRPGARATGVLPGGAAAETSGRPDAAADWTKLVFQSYWEENWDIYVARSDGTQPQRLTEDVSRDIRPKLNRGATQIVFTSQRSGDFDLYKMDTGGANLRQLTATEQTEDYPSWSFAGDRIAFSRVTDDHFGLWVMNADGSGSKQLTTPGNGDDVWPAWSPDGRQVAWIRRTAQARGRVWLMDADGSHQRPYSPEFTYLQNLTWSPDGGVLAFDCDYDGDDWNEIVYLNAYSGELRHRYDVSEPGIDAWMGSWAPDGRSLAITLVAWGIAGGQIVIVETALAQIPTAGNTLLLLPGSGTDMFPDLQSVDTKPPVSTMRSLPSVSPAAIPVQWSGVDIGPSGVAGYDVQVRTGTGGAWEDWQRDTSATQASYPGRGGLTYYFRVRARDGSGNIESWPVDHQAMTLVEALAPNSAMTPLPAYTRQNDYVRWGGTDPGGSGIEWYDVQFRRLPDEVWTDLVYQTVEVETLFWGSSGAQYALRVRAQDRAKNLEAWPPDPGDTTTTVYAWGVRGGAFDNRGSPLDRTSARTTPAAFAIVPSDSEGNYGSFVSEYVNEYSVTWDRPGFGLLPSTLFPNNDRDEHLDAIIPPANNAVADGDFEEASLLPAWGASGILTPTLTGDDYHTGRASAVVGMAGAGFSPAERLSDGKPNATLPQLLIGSNDVIQTVWPGANGIDYRQRQRGKPWQVMQTVSSTDAAPQLVLDGDNRPHIIWSVADGIRYVRQRGDGSWPAAEAIPGVPMGKPAVGGRAMAVDKSGAVHVIWMSSSAHSKYGSDIAYSRRDLAGVWSSPLLLTDSGNATSPWLGIDHSGALHLIWRELHGPLTQVIYKWRSPEGIWSSPRILSGQASVYADPACALDPQGRVHVLFIPYGYSDTIDLVYTSGARDGAWSTPQWFAEGSEPQMTVDGSGTLHAVWTWYEIYHASKPAGAPWSTPERVSNTAGRSYLPTVAVDTKGAVHTAWYAWRKAPDRKIDLWYAARDRQQGWMQGQVVAHDINTMNETLWRRPALGVDSVGDAHVAWYTVHPADRQVYYAWGGTVPEPSDSRLWQRVDVPLSAASPTLSWMYDFDILKAGGGNRFEVTVDDGVKASTVFSTSAVTTGWTHAWSDMTPWAGQTVTVTFNLQHPANDPAAWAFVDEVSLGSGAYPDLWASLPPMVAEAGQTVTTTLSYGNRGSASAGSASLSMALPEGLALANAQPPPSFISDNRPTWELDQVSPGAKSAIELAFAVSPQTPLTAVLHVPIEIESPLLELEQADNQTIGFVFVGGQRWYLPLVMLDDSP